MRPASGNAYSLMSKVSLKIYLAEEILWRSDDDESNFHLGAAAAHLTREICILWRFKPQRRPTKYVQGQTSSNLQVW